jgi:hypothetical protein
MEDVETAIREYHAPAFAPGFGEEEHQLILRDHSSQILHPHCGADTQLHSNLIILTMRKGSLEGLNFGLKSCNRLTKVLEKNRPPCREAERPKKLG